MADVDATCSIHLGDVVPIPIKPLFLIVNLSALLVPLLPVTKDNLAGTDPKATSPSTNPSTSADSCVPDPSYPLNPKNPKELSCTTTDGLLTVPRDLISETPDLPLVAPAEYRDNSEPKFALSNDVLICAPEACKVELVVPIFKPPYMVVLSPTYILPVVVAPPDIVRPPVAVPLPIVEDASEYIPLVNPMSVDVEFAFVEPNRVFVNGNGEPTAIPSDEVAVNVYPPKALPTSIFP